MSETTETPPTPAEAPAMEPRRDRSLLIVLVVVAVLVVAALIAVFARGGMQQLDPSTPEGVVQTYANAVLKGDYETARELHSSSQSAEGCEPTSTFVDSGTRLTLVNTRVNGDFATVIVNVTDSYGGPFGGDSGYQDQFELVRADAAGDWYVTYSPWMFQVCVDQGELK